MDFDPRITPAREDLAAAHLKGKVRAARFVDGAMHVIAKGRAALRVAPAADAGLESELIYGERFVVFEDRNGWAWGQAVGDDCVGYIESAACTGDPVEPDHRVTALATPLQPEPDVKRPPLDLLPMNAKVCVLAEEGAFSRVAPAGFVFSAHLAPLSNVAPDWVEVASRFLGSPYVWGGKTWGGLDCSGLVETAFEAAGMKIPRDTDLQEAALSNAIVPAPDLMNLYRGDLVFWNGHVGVVLEGGRLLHATSSFMEVVIEPLAEAVRRIEPLRGAITSVRRVSPTR